MHRSLSVLTKKLNTKTCDKRYSIGDRDNLVDNYKALLIILVVIGHFVQPCYENSNLLYTIKYVIYTFHMPAFVFISGYLSKKELHLQKAIQRIFIPYLCMQFVYFVLSYFGGGDPVINPLIPRFTLWYLLALFVWTITTPFSTKIPHYFWLFIVCGILFGCLPIDGKYLDISRMIVFYPYFLAGTLFNREKITKLRTKQNGIISLLGICGYIFFIAMNAKLLGFQLGFLNADMNFADIGVTNLEGICIRIICYLIGAFFIFAIITLITERKNLFTKLGCTTMPIYIFHGVVYKILESKTTILTEVDTFGETIILVLCCITLAFVVSLSPFKKFTDFISGIPIDRIKRERTSRID